METTPATQSEIDGMIDNLPVNLKPVFRLSFQEQRIIADRVSEIATVVMGCKRKSMKGLVELMEDHDKKAMEWRAKHEKDGEEWRKSQAEAVYRLNTIVQTAIWSALGVNFILGVLWAMGWLRIPTP